MTQYNIIAENEEYTVVSEYETVYGAPDQYQSEAALEKDFIKTLTEQGYEYLPIHTEKDYNLSVSTYVEQEDTRKKVDIAELNARIKKIVAHENELRAQIDEIIKAL